MGGLLGALNAGKTSLFVNQKGIEVTGNNISNVNTEGYSKQRLETSPYPSLEFNGYFIGHGVQIDAITRQHNAFLASQIQSKNASLGEESAKAGPLTELENIFNISDYNLATDIDNFFDAWQQLSANPGGFAERDMVIQSGETLSDKFHSIGQDLINIQDSINNDIESQLGAINLKLKELADLNKDITATEIGGNTANSLRDRRDILLEDLSYTLGVISYEAPNGMITVSLPSGIPLVNDSESYSFETTWSGNDMQLRVNFGASTLDVNANSLGGEFKGMLSIRDEFIPSLQTSLDKLAYNLVTEVNTQHAAGTGLDNVSNRNFFTALSTQTNASLNIAVGISNANQIAAGVSDAPGDNTNALLLGALGEKKAVDSAYTFSGYYGYLVSTVGIEASQARLNQGGTEDAMVQLKNLRDSVSSVSLEEEMINLIQYQRGFEAASKYLVTIDEMMDVVLSLKR